MMKILFQGDSITDCGRNTSNGSMISIGQGYAMLVCAALGYKYPQEYEFENRGISGNRVVDVYSRIKADGWNLEPDVFSILIGVNDVWHEIGGGNGVDAARYEKVYRMMIEDTLERLPDTKFMILEPFVLKAAATEEKWDEFKREVALRAAAAKRVAEDYNLVFVPLQEKFDAATEKTNDASYWLADGVHPTPAGHGLIAEAWLEAFEKNIK